MADETKTAAPGARPAKCAAEQFSEGYAICGKCGLAWEVGAPEPPACDGMTLGRLRECISAEVASYEASHAAVLELKKEGRAADPLYPLQRAARLRAVVRFLDWCQGNPEVMAAMRVGARRKNG